MSSMTSHFSCICSTCFVRIGWRMRTFTSNFPPTDLRPSISWNMRNITASQSHKGLYCGFNNTLTYNTTALPQPHIQNQQNTDDLLWRNTTTTGTYRKILINRKNPIIKNFFLDNSVLTHTTHEKHFLWSDSHNWAEHAKALFYY